MHGNDGICGSLFSYIGFETRVRAERPLRVIRQIVNAALKSRSGEFAKLYSPIGRRSIPPEPLTRAFPVAICRRCRGTGYRERAIGVAPPKAGNAFVR